MTSINRSFLLCMSLLLCAACSGSTEPTPPPPPVAASLAFTAAPSDVRTQAAFAAAPVVEVRDAAGNRVVGNAATVTLSLAGGSPAASLRGTATVSAVNGIASFAGLSVDSAGTGYTIVAAATGLTSATSTAFAVVRGTPLLAFRTQPVSGEAGLSLTTQPIVEIRDSVTGGILAARQDSVTLTLAANAGSGALAGTARIAAVNGVATFANLVVSVPGTGYLITASGTGLTSAASAPFDVAAIQRTLTIVSGDAQFGSIGSAVAQPLRVRVTRTRGGTPLAGQTVTFDPRAGSTVSPTLPVTNANGEAQTIWTLGPSRGLQTALASFGGTSASVSFSATAIDTVGLLATQIAAGGFFNCAISTPLGAVCWGDGSFGQTGDSAIVSLGPRVRPVRVNSPVPLISVTASSGGGDGIGIGSEAGNTACGLTSGGNAYCWGRNHRGQIGIGSLANARVPVEVRGGRSYKRIMPGGEHTCAITQSDAAFCWGANFRGAIGNGSGGTDTSASVLEPVAVSGGRSFSDIAVGFRFTCALDTRGQAWCWGLNNSGQLGDGTTTNTNLPVAVQQPAGVQFGIMVSGANHTCAQDRADGRTFCWGGNTRGQLGDGTMTRRLTPTVVGGGLTFQSLTAGSEHSCAITQAGDATCWGGNAFGLLGDDTRTARLVPGTLVFGGRKWTHVVAGERHTCGTEAVTERTFCWGSRTAGALGNGTSDNGIETRPQPVLSPIP